MFFVYLVFLDIFGDFVGWKCFLKRSFGWFLLAIFSEWVVEITAS